MRFHIALDSGAHSLFNRFIATKRNGGAGDNMNVRANLYSHSDTSYLSSKQFRQYVDDYAAYVKNNGSKFDFCVTLDVIFDPKRSYELWLELEQQGVRTMPVLHYGEDVSWLKKYMDRTDYLGIGGLGQMVTRSTYTKWARHVFDLLTDKHGRPQWKTHGFAMTSTALMRQYPWSSVDSSSVFYHARMGNVVIPRVGPNGSRDYLRELAIVSLTRRRGHSASHYLNTKPQWREYVTRYLNEMAFDSIEDMGEFHSSRDACNTVTYHRVAKAISDARDNKIAPLKLYISGKLGTSNSELYMEKVPRIYECGVTDFHYMGTHFLLPATEFLLRKGLYNGKAYAHAHQRARPTLRKSA